MDLYDPTRARQINQRFLVRVTVAGITTATHLQAKSSCDAVIEILERLQSSAAPETAIQIFVCKAF